jgi:hypothetical protein
MIVKNILIIMVTNILLIIPLPGPVIPGLPAPHFPIYFHISDPPHKYQVPNWPGPAT